MIKAIPGYQANRARISLALSEFTVPLLSRIYHAFDGDMVAAIVLGEIAHRNVERWLADDQNPEKILHDPNQRTTAMRPSATDIRPGTTSSSSTSLASSHSSVRPRNTASARCDGTLRIGSR